MRKLNPKSHRTSFYFLVEIFEKPLKILLLPGFLVRSSYVLHAMHPLECHNNGRIFFEKQGPGSVFGTWIHLAPHWRIPESILRASTSWLYVSSCTGSAIASAKYRFCHSSVCCLTLFHLISLPISTFPCRWRWILRRWRGVRVDWVLLKKNGFPRLLIAGHCLQMCVTLHWELLKCVDYQLLLVTFRKNVFEFLQN